MTKDMLKKRKEIKSKKPKFLRQDIHKKKKLKPVWRKARGLQSKVRLNISGYRKKVTSGYSSPKEVRGLHASGLKQILVSNLNELKNIDNKTEGIIISSNVGTLKRYEIIKKAIEMKINILNFKDPNKFVSDFEALIESKKKDKSKKAQEKETKRKELEKLADKKAQEEKETKDKEQKSEEKVDEKTQPKEEKSDEKKPSEKKELDKILTKKENN